MSKEKRVIPCVVLSCLNRPGVIWRFFRRYYFNRLNKEIEALPKAVRKLGKDYQPTRQFFIAG